MKNTQQRRAFLSLLVLAFIIVGSGTVLSACQQSSTETTHNDEAPQDRRIGKLASLGGIKTSQQGTHLLQLDDGSTILLKSTAINLDDPKYLNKTVEVKGVLTYTTGDKQVMEVTIIDALEVAPTQQVAAPLWKDYESTKLGYKIRYRDDFVMSESGNTTLFAKPVTGASTTAITAETTTEQMTAPKEHTVTVMATAHTSAETLVKNYLQLKSDVSAELTKAGLTKSKVGIKPFDAYKKVSTDGTKITFYLDSGTNFYEITFTGGKDEQALEDQNLFYDFLNSFDVSGSSSASVSVNTQQTEPEDEEDKEVKPPVTTSQEVKPTSTIKPTQEPKPPVKVEEAPKPAAVETDPTKIPGIPGVSSEMGSTQETLPGYSQFTSTGYKFSVQYPKSWYFSSGASTESDVSKHYEFGNKPIEEQAGDVSLDIMKGGIPAGTQVNLNGTTATKVEADGKVMYYVKGDSGKLYRISGPAGSNSALSTMAQTLDEI